MTGLRAVGHFTHRYGKIDRFESHNEYWLETDARIRTDFNIPGIKTTAKDPLKSRMKKVFEKAGVPVARGALVKTPRAKRLVKEVAIPLWPNPMAASAPPPPSRFIDDAELECFFAQKPDVEYIVEEFIQARSDL